LFQPGSAGAANRQARINKVSELRQREMIYTFYSFKGGVGRSMALSNVAEFLYSRGASVLIVDWDLEAPGLESFFFPPNDIRSFEARSRVGLIDYLDQYRRQYDAIRPKGTFQDAVAELRPVEKFLYPIHPAGPNNPNGGELWLFPAGWRASRKNTQENGIPFDDRFPKYAATVQDFGWSDFYTRYEGQAFFDWFRERLLAGPPAGSKLSEESPQRGFDVILIDSRTGVTEVGGVCTRQLADVVVSFCAPNYQNLSGAERMSESFAPEDLISARGGRSLEVVVIPARVDEAGETDAQNRFREQFEKSIKTPAALQESISSSWQLLLPYITKYAYQESLAIAAADSNQKLEQAYKRLASHLVLLAPSDSRNQRSAKGAAAKLHLVCGCRRGDHLGVEESSSWRRAYAGHGGSRISGRFA
jgi:MinD-like ATPase involved in chromosome partitioning or flagellar assembly